MASVSKAKSTKPDGKKSPPADSTECRVKAISRRDDDPVPYERELLWPVPHLEALGPDLLERLYGDIPRRTRLSIQEICRRLRGGHTHVYGLIQAGSLDAIDSKHPKSTQNAWMIYRYSFVRFLFNREFVESSTRLNLPGEDLDRCLMLAEKLRQDKRNTMHEGGEISGKTRSVKLQKGKSL